MTFSEFIRFGCKRIRGGCGWLWPFYIYRFLKVWYKFRFKKISSRFILRMELRGLL